MSNIRSCWDKSGTGSPLAPSLPPAATTGPWKSKRPRGPKPNVPTGCHIRWSACTPAAWPHRTAGSPSSAGPTRSPARTVPHCLPTVTLGDAGDEAMQAAHLQLVGFDVAAAIRVVPPPCLQRGHHGRHHEWCHTDPNPGDDPTASQWNGDISHPCHYGDTPTTSSRSVPAAVRDPTTHGLDAFQPTFKCHSPHHNRP